MNKNFSFKWKLIENYFNALMVFSFTVLIVFGFVYDDLNFIALALAGAIFGPFIATFIDKRSHEGKRK